MWLQPSSQSDDWSTLVGSGIIVTINLILISVVVVCIIALVYYMEKDLNRVTRKFQCGCSWPENNYYSYMCKHYHVYEFSPKVKKDKTIENWKCSTK